MGDRALLALSQAAVLLLGLGLQVLMPHIPIKGWETVLEQMELGVPGSAQPLRGRPICPLTQAPGPNPPFSRPQSHPTCPSGPAGFLVWPQAAGNPSYLGRVIRSLLAPHFPPTAWKEVSSP